jgi:hypothetical protein
MSESQCPTCCPADPERAAAGWSYEICCIDDSHLRVNVLRCPVCGRRALYLFCELIDWSDGDDSQARIIVPLPRHEAADALALGDDEGRVEALLARLPDGDYLTWICPRGMTTVPTWTWKRGQAFILPHD